MSSVQAVARSSMGEVPMPRRASSILVMLRGVVPGAGLNFIILLALDFQIAVGPILPGVRGCVTDVVLAAQLGSDLIECFPQLVHFIAHVDHPSAGLLGELSHVRLAEVANSAVEAAVRT